ncbi:hypothetical protein FF2_024983 [Malus domestica]
MEFWTMKVGCVGRAAPANPANIGLGRTQIMEIPICRYRFRLWLWLCGTAVDAISVFGCVELPLSFRAICNREPKRLKAAGSVPERIISQ